MEEFQCWAFLRQSPYRALTGDDIGRPLRLCHLAPPERTRSALRSRGAVIDPQALGRPRQACLEPVEGTDRRDAILLARLACQRPAYSGHCRVGVIRPPGVRRATRCQCVRRGIRVGACQREAISTSEFNGCRRQSAGTKSAASSLLCVETYAASARSFTPSVLATFRTVAKLGFPSALRAR